MVSGMSSATQRLQAWGQSGHAMPNPGHGGADLPPLCCHELLVLDPIPVEQLNGCTMPATLLVLETDDPAAVIQPRHGWRCAGASASAACCWGATTPTGRPPEVNNQSARYRPSACLPSSQCPTCASTECLWWRQWESPVGVGELTVGSGLICPDCGCMKCRFSEQGCSGLILCGSHQLC